MGFSFSSMLCFSVVKMQIFKVTFFHDVIKRGLVYTRQRCYSSVHTGQTSALTSCEELHEKLQDKEWHKKLRILDARCNVEPLDYQAMHMKNRIQGSKFFSFTESSDKTSNYPIMMPTSRDFSAYVTSLGISNQHHVIVYDDDDSLGAFFSPRVWWMFRAFGHENISILDGGFGKWRVDGYPTVSGDYTMEEDLASPDQPFKSIQEPKHYVTFEQMKRDVESENPTQLVDTRLLDEFSAGHIPGAKMTPFTDFFNKDKTMKSKEDLVEFFRSSKVDIDSDIISTCQIGVTAALAAHALFQARGKEIPVYDGSFAEWLERAPELVSRD